MSDARRGEAHLAILQLGAVRAGCVGAGRMVGALGFTMPSVSCPPYGIHTTCAVPACGRA